MTKVNSIKNFVVIQKWLNSINQALKFLKKYNIIYTWQRICCKSSDIGQIISQNSCFYIFWFPFGLFVSFFVGLLFLNWHFGPSQLSAVTANSDQLSYLISWEWTTTPSHYFLTSELNKCRFEHLSLHKRLNDSEEDWTAAWKNSFRQSGFEPRSKWLMSSKQRLIQLSYQGGPFKNIT